MDTRFIERFRRTSNLEVVRRLLCRYFSDKISEGSGITLQDSFDRLVYPPSLQDMPFAVPELIGKIEVEPHMRAINAIDDTAELGWNLFVLGTHRKYLGETHHTNLRVLASQIQQGQICEEATSCGRQATPREIVAFILSILKTHGEGYVNLERQAQTLPVQSQTYGQFGGQSQFYRRSGSPRLGG